MSDKLHEYTDSDKIKPKLGSKQKNWSRFAQLITQS